MTYKPGKYYYFKHESNKFIKIYKVLVSYKSFEHWSVDEDDFNVIGLKILDVIVYFHKKEAPIESMVLFKNYDNLYETLEEAIKFLKMGSEDKDVIKTILC